jgi:cAMP phosphodiesterase
MSVQVLGCSGSIAQGCRTTAFLLDDDILIDAGTGVGELPLCELARVDHILLSHSHLDHVLGVPLLADSVMRLRAGRAPIQVYALPHTLDVLRKHLFNDHLWPDFTRLPTAAAPAIVLQSISVGQQLRLGKQQRCIEVLPAAHSVPAVGYAVAGPSGWFVYTGDTGPAPARWQALQDRPIHDLVIEIAFPEREKTLARDSQHHCPSSLVAELALVDTRTQVHLTHCKPGEMPEILADLAAALGATPAPQALRTGQVIPLR